MIHWIWISLISGISVLLITLYINLGGYKDVSIEIKSYPSFNVIYQMHVGAYHKIEPVISEVEKWAKDNDVECLKAFGEYLDKPGSIEDARLRSHGGCVVAAKPSNLPENILYKEVPEQKIIYAVFEGAPSIGPIFVYPKIEEIIEEKKLNSSGVTFEFYTSNGNKEAKTEYITPLKM